MMDINSFIVHLGEQFPEGAEETLTPQTHFMELKQWSSLVSLNVLAMIDMEYDVDIDADEFRTITTIQELYDLVQSRA